jgi:hypothetical protein
MRFLELRQERVLVVKEDRRPMVPREWRVV